MKTSAWMNMSASMSITARAGNRQFGLLSALRAHTKTPHQTDSLWETLRARKRPGRAQTVGREPALRVRRLADEQGPDALPQRASIRGPCCQPAVLVLVLVYMIIPRGPEHGGAAWQTALVYACRPAASVRRSFCSVSTLQPLA
jgi:hypothetical protein